jgi:hypothetical protein
MLAENISASVVPSFFPDRENDLQTLSQLTKLFNQHRRDQGIHCLNSDDWIKRRDAWTSKFFVPTEKFRDEQGNGRAQRLYSPRWN